MLDANASDEQSGRLWEDDESLQRQLTAPVAARGGGSTEGGVEEEEEDVLSCGAHQWLLLRSLRMASR